MIAHLVSLVSPGLSCSTLLFSCAMDHRVNYFQHKENKKADPLTLMTMCFKEVGAVSSARPILDSLVVGMSKVRYGTVR